MRQYLRWKARATGDTVEDIALYHTLGSTRTAAIDAAQQRAPARFTGAFVCINNDPHKQLIMFHVKNAHDTMNINRYLGVSASSECGSTLSPMCRVEVITINSCRLFAAAIVVIEAYIALKSPNRI